MIDFPDDSAGELLAIAQFANARSIRNAIDRARLRQATPRLPK